MKTNAKERRHYLTAMSKYSPEKPLYTPNCIVRRAVDDVEDAVRLLERVRPILCGLAIEVEQKQKVEGTHYLTDAVAVKDEVVAFLKELKQ